MADYKALMSKARKTIEQMDATDKKYGQVTPTQMGLLETLKVAHAAIKCGVTIEDMESICEGQAMLEFVISILKLPPPPMKRK